MAQCKIIAEGFRFPEGPCWSERDGHLYFTDWLGNNILTWDGSQVRHVFSPNPGSGPSGLGLSPEGNFWLSLYDARKLALYSPQGKLLYEVNEYRGNSFRGVCDLAVDTNGGVYFTDSGDFEDDWRYGRPVGSVYYLTPSRELHCVDSGLRFPNGIAITPDRTRLYVNEHRFNRTIMYDILEGERFGPRKDFYIYDEKCLLEPEFTFELGPDGACLDNNGSIWIAHYGGGKLVQTRSNGELASVVHLPHGRKPTNLTYCIQDNKLYATEAEFGQLYQIEF